MSDLYGRKPIFLGGMILFLGGSIFAGLSTSMELLIVGRVIQGFGGGMLIPVAMATVADLYEPRERGKIQGILGAIFAIASAIGPFIGGVIVDNTTWHWAFFVNVPIGIIAIAFTAIKFPKGSSRTKHKNRLSRNRNIIRIFSITCDSCDIWRKYICLEQS